MNTKTLKALQKERRSRFLASLIKEAIINVLAEQEEFADSAPTEERPPFTVDTMIEKLNIIRGGKSFTDPEIYGRLVNFFKTLDEDSKLKFENFLNELVKAVVNLDQNTSNISTNKEPPIIPDNQVPEEPMPNNAQNNNNTAPPTPSMQQQTQ